MDADMAAWEGRLAELREATASDFGAAAYYDASTRRIRWFAASGNSNERYRNMARKPGQDISGEVIRFGRTIQRKYESNEGIRADDVIMHTEKLLVAAASPTGDDPNNTRGVLLIGRRSGKDYERKEIELLEEAAKSAPSLVK
ncbi:GAF domain-containing protein [Paenibacillus thermotolerans]|uniref:GAF domain-containing protein n=1 Tax=Paenibacillus thermotolerans TaxID=3027807 RepID=UPI00236744B5|nr:MULTISPECIES: GAF domain-containing protein [unclassified Paenibacillus]